MQTSGGEGDFDERRKRRMSHATRIQDERDGRRPHMSGGGSLKKSLKKDSAGLQAVWLHIQELQGAISGVLVCIVISSLTTLASSPFTRTLIDDYIPPMLGAGDPGLRTAGRRACQTGAVLLVGVSRLTPTT